MVKDSKAKKGALLALIGVMKGADVGKMKQYKENKNKPAEEDEEPAQED